MKTIIIPIIVTTQEALMNVLAERPPLIYMDEQINGQAAGLSGCDYIQTDIAGKHGAFYMRRDVQARGFYEIYDPMGIL